LACAPGRLEEEPGDTLSRPRYRQTQIHALGGIGQVWLAHDDRIDREVAWKELRPETVNHPAARFRFLREARITGQLEHPGIVPVYDLGIGPTQEPFYVMRFVKGRTLADAIRQYHRQRQQGSAEPLAMRSLVQALVQVCHTLAYAHSRGVLHRDLKGANVVLGDFGEVLVLDWGLAREIHDDPCQESPSPTASPGPLSFGSDTREGEVLGTPGYMAPEQAAGRVQAFDVRTDTYGLGAILYEILTSQGPHGSPTLTEVLRRVQENSPPAPSHFNPTVPRALEAICLKAVSRNPDQRYQTANDLARDLQQWLADEPVNAYREPVLARLARWGRRHRTLMAGLAALLLTAVVALTLGTILVGRQKARAEANLHQAIEVVEHFYVQVSENRLRNEPGMQPLRRELLESARAFLQRFAEDNQNDPARKADLGRVLFLLGRLSGQTGDRSLALAYLNQARDLFQSLTQGQPAVADYRARLADCYLNLGIQNRQVNPDVAEQVYGQALSLYQALVSQDKTNLVWRGQLALCHNDLSALYEATQRLPEAIAQQGEALAIQEQLVQQDPHHRHLEWLGDLAGSHFNLGNYYFRRKDWARAEEHHRKALTLRADLVQREPRSILFRQYLAQSLNNLGELMVVTKRYPQAEKFRRDCLRQREDLVKDNPSVPSYREELAWAYNNLGNLLGSLGRRGEAKQAFDEAIKILENLHHDFPEENAWVVSLGQGYLSLGYFLAREKQGALAVEWFGKAIGKLKDLPLSSSSPVARQTCRDALWSRAETQDQLGRHQEALADWEEALTWDDGTSGEALRRGRARTLARLGQHQRAAAEVEILAPRAADSGEALYDLAGTLALCLGAAGPEESRAVQYQDRALALLRQAQALGFFNEAQRKLELQQDSAFAALRARPAFQQWKN
jgi:serine/threonine-protein kinase